jgi:hypothetical protein
VVFSDSFTTSFLVPLYFLHLVFGLVILAWWFLSKKAQTLKYFGLGMLGYALGIAAWSVLVITKPADLEPLIMVGVIPFLLAHIAYAKTVSVKYKIDWIIGLTILLIVVTLIARTFFFPSKPYFSDYGSFYFGLMPIPLALYITTLSVSLLPAIRAVSDEIEQTSMKSVIAVGLTILFINSLLQITARDVTLLFINGSVASLTLLVLWVKALTSGRNV